MEKAPSIASIQVKIDWSEMDRYGHVNNVMIMKYVQAARVDFWERTGIGSGIGNDGKGANLAATNCKFLMPLFYPGNVKIETCVGFIKTTSFGLQHQLFNDQNDLVAEASDVVVLFNYTAQKKIHISDTLREELTRFLWAGN